MTPHTVPPDELVRLAEAQGWNAESLLHLALTFLQNCDENGATWRRFMEYVQEVAAEENSSAAGLEGIEGPGDEDHEGAEG